MRKSEIKSQVKEIINLTESVRKGIDNILEPFNRIYELLTKIETIEEENMIDTGIDFETTKDDILRNCIEENTEIEEIFDLFENLISDLQVWQEEVSENKSEEIQERYIDILEEIKENFDIASIECSEDLDNQLFDITTQLEEMEI